MSFHAHPKFSIICSFSLFSEEKILFPPWNTSPILCFPDPLFSEFFQGFVSLLWFPLSWVFNCSFVVGSYSLSYKQMQAFPIWNSFFILTLYSLELASYLPALSFTPNILKWCLIACLHFLTTVFSLIPFSLSTPLGLLRTGQLWTSLIQRRQESEPTQQWVTHIHHPPCSTKTALLKGRRGRKQGKILHVVFRSKSVRVTNLILKTGCQGEKQDKEVCHLVVN